MVEIPEDIVRTLSHGLDLDSAACLARAGSCLREVGERALWETVDVVVKPSANDRLVEILQRVHQSLTAYPARASFVKRFRVAVPPRSEGSCDTLLRALKLVSPHVRTLDLSCPPIGVDVNGTSSQADGWRADFMPRLAAEIDKWDRVMDLRLTGAGVNGPHNVAPLLARCPRLQTLVLRPLNIPTAPDPRPHDVVEVPDLPNLTTLAITPYLPPDPGPPIQLPPGLDKLAFKAVHKSYRAILDDLLPHTLSLERLVLDHPHPLDAKVLKCVIEQLPNLKVLYFDDTYPIDWRGTTRVESDLTHLYFKLPTHSATPMRSYGGSYLIPIFPSLEVLTMSLTGDKSQECPFGSDILEDDDAILGLADELQRQPALKSIQLVRPGYMRDDGIQLSALSEIRDDEAAPDKVEWDDLSRLGLILRIYRRPGSFDTDKYDFRHVRNRHPAVDTVWHDVATYRGAKVPQDIISSAYKASGAVAYGKWETTEREARFGTNEQGVENIAKEQEARDVLDEWYHSHNTQTRPTTK